MQRDDGSWSTDDPDRPSLTRDMNIEGIFDYDDGHDNYTNSKIKARNSKGKAIRSARRLSPDELRTVRAEQPDTLFTHPDLAQFQKGDGGKLTYLYQLTALKADLLARPHDPVIIVEGEGCVDRVREAGGIATTNPNGAGKWKPEYSTICAGRNVILLPDNDQRGGDHMEMVAASVGRYANSVKIVELPGLDKHGDVADWLDAGNTLHDLLELAEKTTARDVGSSGGGRRGRAPGPQDDGRGVQLDDFHAFMPSHNYIFAPSGEPWPASSVNARIPPQRALDRNGNPSTNDDGEEIFIPANRWLDQNRPVEQMTWAPGQPQVVSDRLTSEGGWVHRPGCNVFNLYRPPTAVKGDPDKAGPWLDHAHRVYPDDAEHMIDWCAHRVQRPEDKINHALVMGGPQGIGKDSFLEPLKLAVGPWNFVEVSPKHLLGRFNGFVRSVVLRISEARDLGDVDRFAFYDHMKTYTAAPPDVLRVDEKFMREYSAFNVCGVIITTNHKTNGIYLPADDRRHYVAWSDLTKDDFSEQYWEELWDWYADGGLGHVAAYLAQRDISGFRAKAPPPKTQAFWDIVASNSAPEEADLAEAIESLAHPNVVTLRAVAEAADSEFADWLRDRRNARSVPHKMEECGYRPVHNPNATSGRWKVKVAGEAKGKDMMIYGRKELSIRDAIAAAEKLAREGFDVPF